MEQRINWSFLPGEASEDCRQFIRDIIGKPFDKRLSNFNQIMSHSYFKGIDKSILFTGVGPMNLLLRGNSDTSYFNRDTTKVPAFAAEDQARLNDDFSNFNVNNY